MKQTSQINVDLPKIVGKGYGHFWRSTNFYRVVKGSRGSKKSKTTALNFVTRLLKYSWANLLVVRRYSNTNKQSTYTDFKWACNQLKVSHLFKFNESLPEITLKSTGQKILFRGLDDELKITSITVDVGILSWAWFEEAYQIENEDKFSTVVESIRGTLDVPDFYKQITVTFNPWNERHWLKRVFFDDNTRRSDTLALTTTFRCNEWLDEVDIKRYEDLYVTNPRRARIVCDGEWGVAEGLVYENVQVDEFDKEELFRSGNYKLCVGLDFGFTHDPTALVAYLIDDQSKNIYVFDEHYQVGLFTKDIAKMISDKGYASSQIIADCAEARLIEELKSEYGIRRIKASRKGKDSIMAGVSKLQGYQITVHPSCTHIMDEFYSYCYQQDKEGKWLNKPEDKNNHLMDALRYGLQCAESSGWLF
ncbi:PBSX family phage terminase large subunit [Streptococcus minor]|uniref:PBSX family phage terminase large subunit n=1 Tax=Streptococcus minor TaxID=229549 RepID=UPI00036F4409|nr:PBSX family phage terminase large subunit [Streptococcus minor]